MVAKKKTNSPHQTKEKKEPEEVAEKKTSSKQISPTAQVTIDRRSGGDRREGGDRRKQNIPVEVDRRVGERRIKVNRRRQIDPTTCERDYTPDEIEFMAAIDQYKRRSGRMFPTCSEILEVLKSLGYEKRPKEPETPVIPNLECPATPIQNPTTAL